MIELLINDNVTIHATNEFVNEMIGTATVMTGVLYQLKKYLIISINRFRVFYHLVFTLCFVLVRSCCHECGWRHDGQL